MGGRRMGSLKPRAWFTVPPPVPPTLAMPVRWKRFDVLRELTLHHGWTRGAELGLWHGRTIVHLLAHCGELTMIGVDLWQPQPDNPGPEGYEGWDHQQHEQIARRSLRPYGSRATIIKDWTAKAAEQVPDGSLDFVFVDADHSEAGCRRDIEAWLPKIKLSGWMIGHDITWPGVRTAVDDLLPGYEIGPDVTWLRPVNPTPGWADPWKVAR
jgi:hypothetical protein